MLLTVTGLEGGHSGSEIHKEHGNANILMGRFLKQIMDITPFGIISMDGGLKDNAIPRECNCEILLPEESADAVMQVAETLDQTFKNEFCVSDAKVEVLCKKEEVCEELADVFTYCIQMSMKLGGDPEEIILKKLDKTKKKYPIEKSKGISTKYNKL